MNSKKLHQKTIATLKSKLEIDQLQNLIHKFNKQVEQNPKQESSKELKEFITTMTQQSTKHSKKISKKMNNSTPSTSNETTYQQKHLIKDKAIFTNQVQTPYLHSTDTLTNLYKKSSKSSNQEDQIILFNPPMQPYLLTRLKSLHLYYCKIQSFRDMGTGWSNLKQISVYYGQLIDLGGLGGFPCLQFLNVPFNKIQNISQLMFHPTIVSVDLQCNFINQLSQVEHLQTIENLQYLNLTGNPVMMKKQNKRIIYQKFQRKIECQDEKLIPYIKQRERKTWQLFQSQNIQSCNYLLKQFFQISREDQISVQNKHLYMKDNPEFAQPQDIIKIQINTHIKDQQEEEVFQQIIMTPLINFQSKSKTIDPIIKKYLLNKLYVKEQKNKMSEKLETINGQQRLLKDVSKPKISRISRLALTGFTQSSIHPVVEKQQMSQTYKEVMSTTLQKKGTFKRNKLSLSKEKKSQKQTEFKINFSQCSSVKNQNRLHSINKLNRLFKPKMERNANDNSQNKNITNDCIKVAQTEQNNKHFHFKRRKNLSRQKKKQIQLIN